MGSCSALYNCLNVIIILGLSLIVNITFGQRINNRNGFDSTECNTRASFSISEETIFVGVPVELSNRTLNAPNLFWFCDNQKIDSVDQVSYTFRKTGIYEISLVVFDDKCADTARCRIEVNSGGWSHRARFEGEERAGAVSFILGKRAYVATGYDGSNYLKDLWMWNKATNVWTQKADFGGQPRAFAVGFGNNTKGYIGTGSNGMDYFSDFWEYNSITNSWSKMTDNKNQRRSSAIAFMINDTAYFGLGKDSTGLLNDFWKYDLRKSSWSKLRNFSTIGRSDAFALSIGNKGYIGCGADTAYIDDFWEYHPIQDEWTQIEKYPGFGRVGMVGFTIDSTAFIGTGADSISSKNDFWEYTPSFGKWKKVSNLSNLGRTQAVAFAMDGKGYVCGGFVGIAPFAYYSKEIIEYNPDNCGIEASFIASTTKTGAGNTIYFTNTSSSDTTITNYWFINQELFAANRNHASTSYTFNSVGDYTISLISENSFCRDSTGQVINVVCSGKWDKKNKYPSIGRAGAVGFAIGDKGYFGLGYNRNNNQLINLNDFWEWDYSNDSWTQKSDFPGPSRHGAFAFANDNKAYVGCGDIGDTSSIFVNDFWEYCPQTNFWTEKERFPGAPRSYASSFSINKMGYITSGLSKDSTFLSDLYSYNIENNNWIQKEKFPGVSRAFAVGFNIKNKGYFATGKDADDRDLSDFWEYDPTIDKWQKKVDLPIGRNSAIAFGIGSKAYIGFGVSAGESLKDFWEFNIKTNRWIQKRKIDAAERANAIGFAIGNHGFVGFGLDRSGAFINDFLIYSPDSCVLTGNPPSTNITVGSSKNTINNSVWLNVDAGNNLYYQWKKNNYVITDANCPYYLAKESGKYSVVVSSLQGVGYISDVVNVILGQNDEKQKIHNLYDAKTFYQYGLGYGYSIYENGILIINQPNIPAYSGFKGFEKESDAKKVAEFVVAKLRKKIMPPSVSVSDLKNLNVVID